MADSYRLLMRPNSRTHKLKVYKQNKEYEHTVIREYGIYSIEGDDEYFDTPEDLIRYYQSFAHLSRCGFLPEEGQVITNVLHRPRETSLKVARDTNSPGRAARDSLHGTF